MTSNTRFGGNRIVSMSRLIAGAAVGAATIIAIDRLMKSTNQQKERQGRNVNEINQSTQRGNDGSLFYGDVSKLTTTTKDQKFLTKKIYAKLVRDCVLCCIDCLIVRQNDNGTKECFLVRRATEPVKGVWWFPGGRILKGETFFAAAKRKVQQETGLTAVIPVHVLGVWNTFFPTSCWDTDTQKGTQTVNTIVLVELTERGASPKLDDTSEDWKWIGLDPVAAENRGEDKYVVQALRRLQDWNPCYNEH